MSFRRVYMRTKHAYISRTPLSRTRLSRTPRYLDPQPISHGFTNTIYSTFARLSRTRLSRTPRYLEQILDSRH